MEVFGSRRFAFLFSSKFVNLKMIFDIYLFIYFHTKAFSTNVPSSEAVRLQLDQFKITNSRKLKKWKWLLQGILKKTHFQNAAGATVHWLNHHLLAPLVSED